MNNKSRIVAGVIGLIGVMLIITALVWPSNKKYTVTFDTDGGSLVNSQIVTEGEKVIKPADPIKDGYSFLNWSYNDTEYDFSKEVKSDMTLKAIWEDSINKKYIITFTVGDKVETIEVSSFDEIDFDNFTFETKDGYEIIWYLNDTAFDFNSPLTSDITLVGKYEKVDSFTVKFDSSGGTKVKDIKVKSGEKVTEPAKITKYGYIFTGWYLGNTKFNFSTPITKSIKLVAKWNEDPKVKRYVVTFNSDGGSKVDNKRVMENETVSKPANPTKKGFIFLGWYLDNKAYDFKQKVTKDIALVAKWKELEKYTITFDSNGGSNVSNQTVIEGNKATKPTNPKKSGFEFVEWQLNGKKYDFNSIVTGNITLVAKWEEIVIVKYTVKFDSNGGSSVADKVVTKGNKVAKPSDPTKSNFEFVEWQLNGKKYDFNSPVTADITLVAKWKEKAVVKDVYTIIATKADNFSPDRILKVYKNNSQITVKEIKYSDGVHLCNGSNTTVSTSDIEGETSFIVVLTNGQKVVATLK